MSGYTIGEITVWLLLTAVLGFALGWLCRELVLRARPTAPRTVPATSRPEPVAADDDGPAGPGPEVTDEASPEPVVVPGPHPGSALPLDDGSAPSDDYSVKVSRSSKIFHGPASPAFARTTAAMWFTDEQAAEDAGFRRPKNA